MVGCIDSYDSADFTDAEKAAIRYAELLAANHTAIDETAFAELLEHFSEAQILELGWSAAAFIAYGRLIHTFGCRPS